MAKDLKTFIILFKTHQYMMDNVKKTLQGTGVNLNEFTALEALYSKGKLTTQELIQYVLIPNSSMTYVLDTLEKKEYIERMRDEIDARKQYIQLTHKGHDIFAELFDEHAREMRQIFDVLSENEEIELQRLLKKIGFEAQKRGVHS